MTQTHLNIENIPAILWGEPSDRVYLFVHGKMSSKESAESFACVAAEKGWQVLSFDLPEHGDRRGEPDRCDVWNGPRDLKTVARYAQAHWQRLALYGCSLGAYFSLLSCSELPLERCLFQSPVVDMGHLIQSMFQWFSVTEAQLREQGEIATPVDPLRWDYYQFVQEHPIERWPIPTAILYGSEDNLQSLAVMEAFAKKFRCQLTVSPGSGHPFDGPGDDQIVEAWLREQIQE
jgi:pimeloyl-ACP methyl ester carboxylesterase